MAGHPLSLRHWAGRRDPAARKPTYGADVLPPPPALPSPRGSRRGALQSGCSPSGVWEDANHHRVGPSLGVPACSPGPASEPPTRQTGAPLLAPRLTSAASHRYQLQSQEETKERRHSHAMGGLPEPDGQSEPPSPPALSMSLSAKGQLTNIGQCGGRSLRCGVELGHLWIFSPVRPALYRVASRASVRSPKIRQRQSAPRSTEKLPWARAGGPCSLRGSERKPGKAAVPG